MEAPVDDPRGGAVGVMGTTGRKPCTSSNVPWLLEAWAERDAPAAYRIDSQMLD